MNQVNLSGAVLSFTAAVLSCHADGDVPSQSDGANLDTSVVYRMAEPDSGADAKAPTAPASDDATTLAKKLSNPVANLISVPFQLNYDKGFGPNDANKFTLNIQPVIPVSISDDWNIIFRTILPVIYQDAPAPGMGDKFGLGDTTASQFFSPKEPGPWGLIWGVGPVEYIPTATDSQLGQGQLGLGPTAVVLKQDHGWTYGILANHIWRVAGSHGDPNVNASYMQPFVAYTWPTATTLTLNTESTYDWTAKQWTTPLNLMLSQVFKIGEQPVSFQIGGRYYAESPAQGPTWGLRFNLTFLFPR